MNYTTKYIGLDVSKETIAVAIAETGREKARYWGSIPHEAAAIRKLLKQLGKKEELEICYEAGPTGYGLHRLLQSMGVRCMVVAPSLIPVRPGEQVKTDRRDSIRLAELLRAGELTGVYVPTPEDEALRDLVRAREDAREDLHRCKQRVLKFLLRYSIEPPVTIKRRWTQKYREWLGKLAFSYGAQEATFREYLHTIREAEERLKRIEESLLEQAAQGSHATVIQAIKGLRGIAFITAVSLAAEIGSFSRFRSPMQLMAYLGLVPREYSSGQLVRRGRLTKAGNAHARRLLVEAAWSYRYRPAIKGELAERIAETDAEVQSISWKAQNRLHNKYRKLVSRGKNKNVAIAAVARELAGFVWAVACHVEKNTSHTTA